MERGAFRWLPLAGGSGKARIQDLVKRIAGGPAYVSFDIDVADPAFAPGTGTPAAGGLTSREALALVRSLQSQFGISTANVIGHATANAAPQFHDRLGWHNDHADWQTPEVRAFRKRL